VEYTKAKKKAFIKKILKKLQDVFRSLLLYNPIPLKSTIPPSSSPYHRYSFGNSPPYFFLCYYTCYEIAAIAMWKIHSKDYNLRKMKLTTHYTYSKKQKTLFCLD